MLCLLKRQDPPAATPTLSPARQALADNLAEIVALHARYDQLSEPQRRATAAERQEAEARRGVELVASAEDAQLAAWSSAPSGPLPAPLSAERDAALARFADFQYATQRAREQAETAAPHVLAVSLRIGELHKRTEDLINGVMLEEATIVARQYYDAVAAMNAALSALYGIRDALRHRHHGRGIEVVNLLIGGGSSGPERERRQRGQTRSNSAVLGEWAELPALLAEDPAASVALRPYKHDEDR